jgi:hypothetical protein
MVVLFLSSVEEEEGTVRSSCDFVHVLPHAQMFSIPAFSQFLPKPHQKDE